MDTPPVTDFLHDAKPPPATIGRALAAHDGSVGRAVLDFDSNRAIGFNDNIEWGPSVNYGIRRQLAESKDDVIAERPVGPPRDAFPHKLTSIGDSSDRCSKAPAIGSHTPPVPDTPLHQTA